jgi:hypothetical protein
MPLLERTAGPASPPSNVSVASGHPRSSNPLNGAPQQARPGASRFIDFSSTDEETKARGSSVADVADGRDLQTRLDEANARVREERRKRRRQMRLQEEEEQRYASL